MNKDINEGLKSELEKEKSRKFLRKLFLGTSLVLFFVCVSIYAVIRDKNLDTNTSFVLQTSNGSIAESKENCSNSEKLQPIYLTGSVVSPGIYEVKTPIYLYEIVKLAGGLSDDADTEKINLAFLIDSNMMIKIPSKAETKAGVTGGYTTKINISNINGFDEEQQKDSKININTANSSKLCELPGVGESTAALIIKHREKNGSFKKIEDIMKVSGIKQNRFDNIKDFITIS